MKILFRADANLEIGSGHLMRCLTLAGALKKKGASSIFLCRAGLGALKTRIANEGHELILLPEENKNTAAPDNLAHSHWLPSGQINDAQNCLDKLIDMPKADWLIVDHYALDYRWQAMMRQATERMLAIDDLADRTHECDLLLDQNLVNAWQSRYQGKVPKSCGLMLGTKYALLQPIYAELHERIPPREGFIKRIFVYFGGADSDNLTGRTIAAFLALERADIVLDVVISGNSIYAAEIRHLAEKYPQINLHEDIPSLAPLMVQADLAIGASGATSWERCALGLPSLVISLADNQIPIAEALHRLSLVRYLGHKSGVDKVEITKALQHLCSMPMDQKWSENCRQEVDGCGVLRVANILLLNKKTKLHARLACLYDEALLLEWANDPATRENAFSPEIIDPKTHQIWFYKRLRDIENCQIYIVETEDKLPIGQVRFDKKSGEWEISYALDIKFRKRQLGATIIEIAMATLRKNNEGALLLAKVKATNKASIHVFRKLSFSEEITNDKMLYRRII